MDFISDYAQKGYLCDLYRYFERRMLAGPNTALYREILENQRKAHCQGGISSIDDLIALQETGCEGAIISKAIY